MISAYTYFAMHSEYIVSVGNHFGEAEPLWWVPLKHHGTKRG